MGSHYPYFSPVFSPAIHLFEFPPTSPIMASHRHRLVLKHVCVAGVHANQAANHLPVARIERLTLKDIQGDMDDPRFLEHLEERGALSLCRVGFHVWAHHTNLWANSLVDLKALEASERVTGFMRIAYHLRVPHLEVLDARGLDMREQCWFLDGRCQCIFPCGLYFVMRHANGGMLKALGMPFRDTPHQLWIRILRLPGLQRVLAPATDWDLEHSDTFLGALAQLRVERWAPLCWRVHADWIAEADRLIALRLAFLVHHLPVAHVPECVYAFAFGPPDE